MRKKSYSFQEYKMFYESTEKVTDRRITINKYNYAVSVAILGAISLIFQWTMKNAEYLNWGIISIAIFSIAGLVFSTTWIGQLEYFKILNDAKFKILNQMEASVIFKEYDVDSFQPFTKEWEDFKKLQNDGKEKGRKRPIFRLLKIEFATNSEKVLPKSFQILFLLVFLACLADSGLKYLTFS